MKRLAFIYFIISLAGLIVGVVFQFLEIYPLAQMILCFNVIFSLTVYGIARKK